MKIGYYCESRADQAAMAVFTEAILGQPSEPISMDLEAHSVPAFFRSLDGVFRGVHFNSDAEALVIVADCDDAELHESSHDAPGHDTKNCRLCEMRKIVGRARNQLKARPVGSPLKVAIGVTVPAIEAWYLVGKNHQVGEAAWRVGLQARQRPFTKSLLKQLVYETDRPSLELETQRAIEEAQRVIRDLSAIETAFPIGFGLMAQEIRSWVPR